MANKKKRISWKTEFLKLEEAHLELSRKYDVLGEKHNKAFSLHQETLSKLNEVESRLESKEKINNALKVENDRLQHISKLYAETKDDIRNIVYNKKYNTLFGGVSELKADILNTL